MDKFDIIEEVYERVLEQSKDGSHPEYLLDITKSWRDGIWRMYTLVLDRAEYSFEGKVVLDFGCKYGHILPMFLALGASEAIGVDAEEVYVEPGAKFFSSIYHNIKIKQTMKGLLPHQPDSVDFIKWRLWGKESQRIRELFTPDDWRGGSESFMVRGVKLDPTSTI